MHRRYLAVSEAWRERFGGRVQRVPVAVDASCPVRDGTLGIGGCAFCAEGALALRWLDQRGSVQEQVQRGLAAIRRRFGARLAMVYFQNHTATWRPAAALAADLDAALSVPGVVGVAVGARPDALGDEVLAVLARAARRAPIEVELGLQSAREQTLVEMGRGHGVAAVRDAAARVKAAGLGLTLHVIVGWPGEDAADARATVRLVNELGADGVKLHNLHVLRGTALARRFAAAPFPLPGRDEYLALVADLLAHLALGVVVHRVVAEALPDLLVAPDWMRAPGRFRDDLDAVLAAQDLRQGCRRP